jgi:hypothetical protein
MNRTLIVVATLSLIFPLAGMAQSTMQNASVSTPSTPRELRSLIASAHTSAQYKQLATYFHQRESDDRAKAAAEKIERDRRAQVNAGLYQKYPRPVDSAQYLYEEYLSEADHAELQARHYDQLAAGQTKPDDQLATISLGKS